ncbi:hypothetical protein SNE40_017512 [Patella caerulea]|uniref:G-protein coupled receptors family 1 profile domain-containing protein n=1 Tax=Patella caerulea TaxID=87958 RepID=A0AAN8PM23_PATCE
MEVNFTDEIIESNITSNLTVDGQPDYVLHTELICNRFLMPIICSIGIVGNLLSLVVLTRREMVTATNCFLTGLGVSDLCLLLVQIPAFFELNSHLKHSPEFLIIFRHYVICRYVFTNMFITCTCWITVAVTVERCISLCFLMHARMTCTIPRAKQAIVVIYVASFIFHFSKFFEYTANMDVTSPRSVNYTALVLNKAYETYVHICTIMLAAIIPVFLLIIFNSFLIYFLSTHRRRMARRSYNTSSMSSVDMMHISLIVVTMVLVFIICHSIGVFLAMTIAIDGRPAVFENPLYVSFKYINNLLVMFNSSINFLLYCAISKKFRTTFMTVFLGKLLGKKTSWSYKSSVTEQSLSTKIPVTNFVSQSTSSSSNKSGDHSQM